jgi:hypothetical protein
MMAPTVLRLIEFIGQFPDPVPSSIRNCSCTWFMANPEAIRRTLNEASQESIVVNPRTGDPYECYCAVSDAGAEREHDVWC